MDLSDLIDNPTPRVPVTICLDVSSSMGNVIQDLQRGIEQFKQALCDDEMTLYSAETSIITFGEEVKEVVPFGPPDSMLIPKLRAWGMTPLGEATLMAIDKLNARKKLYKDNGIEYFQPWLIIMTDGDPNDHHNIPKAIAEIENLVSKKKLTVFVVMIGDGVNPTKVAPFSPKRPPIKLQGARFSEFFEWLGASMQIVSQSKPGDDSPIQLNIDKLKAWATI